MSMPTARALLEQLRQLDESDRIEAKRGSAVGGSALETVCAFANEPGLGGGYLLLGVEKRSDAPGDYGVTGIEDPDKLLNDLHSRCASVFNVPVRIQARAEVLEGRTVIVVDVPEADPASRPVHFAKSPLPRSAWRRGPSGDYRCNQDDVAALFLGRAGQSHDASVMPGAGLDDLDPDALEHYRDARRAVSPGAEELNFSDEELLEALGAVARKSNRLHPTVAGVLLFGRRGALRRLFPANRVDYIRIPGKEWIEDPHERFTTLDMRDTLPRLIQRATAAVLDDLPRAFQLPEGEIRRGEKTVLPDKVVREAVVNAVMHRNYQRQQPIQLLRYSNRLEVQNPGYSLKALENLGEPGSQWRNPVIASVLHEMGLAETKGSGIRVMRRLMDEAGLSPPSFDSNRHTDQFAATYLFHHFLSEADIAWLGQFRHLGLGEDEQRALIFIRETGRITNADYRDLNRVDPLAASQRLAHLRGLGLVEQVPRGSATYYVPAEWLELPMGGVGGDLFANLSGSGGLPAESGGLPAESGGLPAESGGLPAESGGLPAESGGLPAESGGLPAELLLAELPEPIRRQLESLGQRSRDTGQVEEAILALCALRPWSLRELAVLTKRNSAYLRQRYLVPMVAQGQLQRTFPNEPNRPDQAYVVPTKKGG
ncbi:ATP-binding protein [Alkalilimnicola sp. S0819]|uniref:ATP-binding protein n=1 Tax=Alkalilimnicola sp. S0819 TaxID=2613922 RepID=UPI0012628F8A|nr:ATP-binding protein [Alkalilimnicola sp. S0819]KAB7624107.1 transcriptional regulator [Alkalilimnicola sp. S0819]MPQ16358.1 transcriptional regulator [Alkalilimnicola sp. S0819]